MVSSDYKTDNKIRFDGSGRRMENESEVECRRDMGGGWSADGCWRRQETGSLTKRKENKIDDHYRGQPHPFSDKKENNNMLTLFTLKHDKERTHDELTVCTLMVPQEVVHIYQHEFCLMSH